MDYVGLIGVEKSSYADPIEAEILAFKILKKSGHIVYPIFTKHCINKGIVELHNQSKSEQCRSHRSGMTLLQNFHSALKGVVSS